MSFVLFSSCFTLLVFCLFSGCHHTLRISSDHVKYYFATKPHGSDSTSGLTELSPHPMGMAHSQEVPVWTSNPMGIDLLQDVTETYHPSYNMLTKMRGSATGVLYLTTLNTTKTNYTLRIG